MQHKELIFEVLIKKFTEMSEEKDKEITELKTTVQVKEKWMELKEIWLDYKDTMIRDKDKDIAELKAQLDQERNNALSILEKMKTE